MGRHGERKITLPAGMELVVPPRPREDLEDEPRPGAETSGTEERATHPPAAKRGDSRRA